MSKDFITYKEPNDTVYLNIYEGMLCERSATPKPDYIEYISKSDTTKGKVSYVRIVKRLKGYIVGFQSRQHETLEGKKYRVAQIVFDNGQGKKAMIVCPIDSEFVSRFAKCVENMNLAMPVEVSVFRDKQRGKTSVAFYQNGQKVDQKYSKENPNGIPEWKTNPMTGKADTSAYWSFLFNIISEYALPRIEHTRIALEEMKTLEKAEADISTESEGFKEETTPYDEQEMLEDPEDVIPF